MRPGSRSSSASSSSWPAAGWARAARRRPPRAAARPSSRSRATSAPRRWGTRAQDGPRRRDRDAPAAAQVRRSRRATAAASCRRSTGVGGGRESGRPVDWFYYVNGIEAGSGAGDAQALGGRPRVVGPPRLGRRDARSRRSSARSRSRSRRPPSGKKIPIRLVCADDAVKRLLRRGPQAARGRGRRWSARTGTVGTRAGPEVLRRARRALDRGPADPTAARLEQGPKVSGVFARPSRTARRSRCSTRAGGPCGRSARARAWSRRRSSSTRSRRGWSPAPTTWASPRRRRRWSRIAAEGPLRGRDRRRARGVPIPLPVDATDGAVTYRRRSIAAARGRAPGSARCAACVLAARRARRSSTR